MSTFTKWAVWIAFCGCLNSGWALSPDQLYPQGDLFPIGGYSGQPERDLANGFTWAGPVYRNHEEFLETCTKVGLPCVYPVGVSLDFHGKKGDAVTSIDPRAIREEIQRQVREVMENRLIVVWYLTPEELRFWKPLEMEYLEVAYKAIRDTDPYKRPVWMYEPGHRTAGALARLLPFQDISGKGMYVNYSSRMDERIWVRWSMEQQAKAIQQANRKAMSIAVPEMFRQPPADRLEDIELWVRHDTYSSLIHGAKGIVIFSFGRRSNFSSRERYYEAWAAVARELTNPENPLGTVFLRGEELPQVQYRMLSGPKQVTLRARSTIKEAQVYPSLQSKHLRWRNREYLFLVNSSAETLSIDLNVDGWKDDQQIPRRQVELSRWEVIILNK